VVRTGSVLAFVGGAIGRVAGSGLVIGAFFVLTGFLPWEFFVNLFNDPPAALSSVWFVPSLVLIGFVIIGVSLWYNQWSQKQVVIDDLAEDMSWAIHHLLNKEPRPTTNEAIAEWEREFREWCAKVSKKLENRAFFTRADQLHFDRLGFVTPVRMTGHERFDWLLGQLKLKFERLRDVINWSQQRRR
jgi:hypothetical protein